MNKITRRFLSGASLFALSFGLPTTAARADSIIINTTVTGVTVPHTPTYIAAQDFIVVTANGKVSNDIILNTAIIGNNSPIGIDIQSGGIVSGSIINNSGIITASTYGIAVQPNGYVGGNISNGVDGIIVVNPAGTLTTFQTIAGIADFGTVSGVIHNSGLINVLAGGQGDVYGIYGTGSDLFLTVENGPAGRIIAIENTNTAGFVTVDVAGIGLTANSDLQAVVTNGGEIRVVAGAVAFTTAFNPVAVATAHAHGIFVSNSGNADGASANFAHATNTGSMKVKAIAVATDSAWALATGVELNVDGGGGATATAKFLNKGTTCDPKLANGCMTVSAVATGSGTVFAGARGVSQSATDATALAKVSAVNSGQMVVNAKIVGTTGHAVATAINQFATVDTGGAVSAFAKNAGDLLVGANAIGSGYASAYGVV
ncbi:MAG: hypothetical protein ACREMY_08600, partial [bacterium]